MAQGGREDHGIMREAARMRRVELETDVMEEAGRSEGIDASKHRRR